MNLVTVYCYKFLNLQCFGQEVLTPTSIPLTLRRSLDNCLFAYFCVITCSKTIIILADHPVREAMLVSLGICSLYNALGYEVELI